MTGSPLSVIDPVVGFSKPARRRIRRALAAAGRTYHDRQLAALDRERALADDFLPEMRCPVALADLRCLELAGLDATEGSLASIASRRAHRSRSHGVTRLPSARRSSLEMKPAMPMLIMPTTICS